MSAIIDIHGYAKTSVVTQYFHYTSLLMKTPKRLQVFEPRKPGITSRMLRLLGPHTPDAIRQRDAIFQFFKVNKTAYERKL